MSATCIPSEQMLSANSKPPIVVSQCKKILVVKMDHIGDFILTTPLLRGLRKSAPDAEIDLIVSPKILQLAEICPFVNRVISAEIKQLPDNKITISLDGNTEYVELYKKDCTNKSYDLAIVPRYEDDFKLSSFVAACSGAKRIVGFSVPSDRWAMTQDYAKAFYTDIVHRPFAAHEVEHYQALLQYVNGVHDTGPVDIWTLQDDMDSASRLFHSAGLKTDKPILAVCPGATGSKKSLPADKFLSILRRVEEVIPDAQFVVLGSESERAYAQRFQPALKRCFDLCAKTSLRELVAAIAQCTVVVSADAGQAHIAAAVDIPSVVFFRHPLDGSSRDRFAPERFRSWGSAECIILQPKHAVWPCNLWPGKPGCQAEEPHCILSILDEDAVQAIVKLTQKQLSAKAL